MPANTSRLALPYPVPADTVDVPRDVLALAGALDPLVAVQAAGSAAARPAAGKAGRFYWDTTVNGLEFDNGTTWVSANAPLVTALPTANLFDGQEVTLQTASMASDGIAWKFRYRASGGTYKWEFVGGALWRSAQFPQRNPFNTTGGATAWTRFDSPNIALFTAPAAGDYWVTGMINVSFGNACQFWLATMINGVVGTVMSMAIGNAGYFWEMPFHALATVAAGQTIGIMAATNNVAANAAPYGVSAYQVIPVRAG